MQWSFTDCGLHNKPQFTVWQYYILWLHLEFHSYKQFLKFPIWTFTLDSFLSSFSQSFFLLFCALISKTNRKQNKADFFSHFRIAHEQKKVIYGQKLCICDSTMTLISRSEASCIICNQEAFFFICSCIPHGTVSWQGTPYKLWVSLFRVLIISASANIGQ